MDTTHENLMIPSKRLTIVLIGLMFIPMLSVGFIILTTAWLYPSPEGWGTIFSHWIRLLLIAIVFIGCMIVAIVLSHNISEQIALITNAVRTMTLGKESHRVDLHHLYQEFHPLYEYLKHHTEFHDELTKTLADIVRNTGRRTLELRSEEDEFIKLVNILIARLQNMYWMTTAIAEGNLAALKPVDEPNIGPEKDMYTMIAELGNLILKARNYTNQMVRAGSQINSITTQGLQDTKIATKRIDDISQFIHQMATNIQHVAEHLQEQSSLLGDTSSSLEHTIRSVEDIADNITNLKSIVEKTAPSAQASEETAPSLDLMYNATKAIEKDANTCVMCSQEAAEEAEQGKIVVQQTIAGINRIQESMDELFGIVRRLGERAEEVSETLDVISDIADHTNLLAINAAIISAHAGEHGRDFAVIADEIGKFAERTRESTDEIEELLKTIQAEFDEALRAMNKSSKTVSNGVELSHQAGKTLGKIASSIFSTKELVSRIAAATADQSRENDHIRNIMRELGQVQEEKHKQVNNILWQLMQAIAQIRGITSEQAEGSARIVATARNLDQITQEISQATTHHVTTANQIIDAVQYIRKLVQRTTLGTEKTAQLTDEIFTLGGSLALTMGEFVLSNRTLPPEITAETQVIGFVRRGPESFFDYMAVGIQAEAEQHGFQILEINSQYEATTQVEDVNWLLKQSSLKGIILCSVDTHVAQQLIQKGGEQGIPCVAADESVAATISVRSGNREGGQRAAELFIGHLQHNAVIGVMVDRTVKSIVRRFEGFRQRAEQYPFDIVEIYYDMTDREKGKDYMVSGIKDNPGLQGIFLANELLTTTYLNALHSGLLPSSDLLAVGYDHTPLAEEAIRTGELLGAIFQNPEEIGKQAFQYLYKLIKKQIRVEDFDEGTIYIPTVKVTQETLLEQTP
jgi:methyl-accepting chemotaxis protein/ABC-type sugar transport system substrate-binding protein